MTAAKMVRLQWTCSHPVGDLGWKGTEAYEFDECGAEFETQARAKDIREKNVTATCPNCKGTLDVEFDDPEVTP